MKHEPHDQHFKNLFLDFPKEALEGFLPQAIEDWRPIQQVEFMRPEPKKQRLSNRHLALDMPILFTFQQHQLLLWLSERALNQFHRFTSDVGGVSPCATVGNPVKQTVNAFWRFAKAAANYVG